MIEEIKSTIDPTRQARRWCFTINNPFSSKDEVNPETTDIPYKEDYYSPKVIKDLEESGCFDFKYIKVRIGDDLIESKESIIRRPFFKDINSAINYLSNISSLKYCIFQLEKGEEGTEHLQGFISFTSGRRFRTVKDILPIAHIEKAMGTNSQCRDYCSKEESRVAGPWEFGEFCEERERTDCREFISLASSGISKTKIANLLPSQYVNHLNKIDEIYAHRMSETYSRRCRRVKVTYIYGPTGAGKTSMIRKNLKKDETFWVQNYDLSMFTNYNYENNIVFDEFTGDIKISTLNPILDVGPVQLRGLRTIKYGAYHNVFIVSNYPPTALYTDVQIESPDVFATFMRRIHTIVYIDKEGNQHIQRQTEWEPETDPIDIEQGLTERIKRVCEFDQDGNPIVIFDHEQYMSTRQTPTE